MNTADLMCVFRGLVLGWSVFGTGRETLPGRARGIWFRLAVLLRMVFPTILAALLSVLVMVLVAVRIQEVPLPLDCGRL